MYNPYEFKALELLKIFKDLKKNGDWHHLLTKDMTKLYSVELNNECSLPCYMVTTLINKSQEEMINKIWFGTTESFNKYDDHIISLETIERCDDWRVVSLINGLHWPFWPRQLVYSQTKIVKGKITYLISYSIDHPLLPKDDNKYVRAQLYLSIHEFVDNNDYTVITRIQQVDPCGNIPQIVVNMVSNKLIDMFNMWEHE